MEHNLEALKKINQITLPNSFFLCDTCKSYLFAPIWSSPIGANLCDACYKKDLYLTYVRNDTLEALQDNWQYPCAYNQCRFIGTRADAQKHMASCQAFAICPMCFSQESLHRLSEHFVHGHGRSMNFAGPARFTQMFLDLPQRNPHRVFELSTLGNKWLLISSVVAGDKVNVVILKCYDARYEAFERIVQDDFVFKWRSRNTQQEFQVKAKTCSYLDYCKGRAAMIEIPAPMRERLDLDIHFNNYEQAVKPKTSECPVCFDSWDEFSAPKNICQNGHSVCNDCRPSIQQCPLCREPLRECVNPWFRYVELNQCKYKGCIRKGGIFSNHEKSCSHLPRQCPECKETLPLADLIRHLKAVHENFTDGFGLPVNQYINGTRKQLYCVYKKYLFRLTIYPNKENTCFMVNLMFETDEKLAMRHRFELHFHHAAADCQIISKYKLANICQLQEGLTTTAKLHTSLITTADKPLNNSTFSFYIFDS